MRPAALARTALLTAAVTALTVTAVPGAHAATASPASCQGVTVARFPAVSGIAGGHLWWRAQADGTCIGTIVIDIRYTAGDRSQPWQVIIYDDQHPEGNAIIREDVPAPDPGVYQFTIGVHQVFAGLAAVCVGAVSCVELDGT